MGEDLAIRRLQDVIGCIPRISGSRWGGPAYMRLPLDHAGDPAAAAKGRKGERENRELPGDHIYSIHHADPPLTRYGNLVLRHKGKSGKKQFCIFHVCLR